MLWGDPPGFAVEAELTAVQGKWRLGRFRFWIGEVPVGDFEDTVDLAAGARWGRCFLLSSSKRTRPDLEPLRPEQVFHELFGRYFAPGAPIEPLERDPYLLDDVGESSLRDRATVLVFRQRDGFDRLIARSWVTGTTQQIIVEPGHVDDVIRRFCEWVESL